MAKSVRWPGRPWLSIAKTPKAPATLVVRLPWGDDLFAPPTARADELGLLWDRMWGEPRHTFFVSTRHPERLSRFVRSRAFRRGFGWTDLGRPPLSPGAHVGFDDLYYRNQCGCVGPGDWECLHPENPGRGEDDSCDEYECPISCNVQDRKTLAKIGVADEYEYDDEGFTEDSTSWQEIHSRPRYGQARNVWLGFRADTQAEFERGARVFRHLRDRLGPYATFFAETTCPVKTTMGYHADSPKQDAWDACGYQEYSDGGHRLNVPYLNWIVVEGIAREIPWVNPALAAVVPSEAPAHAE